MTQNEWAKLARDYHAAKVAAAKEKKLAEQIKNAMAESGVDIVEAGGFILTAKEVKSKRFNQSLFAKENPELCEKYKEETVATRLYLK